jgi:hypothetical protein
MDISSLTLAGLVAIGAVNAISFFKADLDSKIKFAISFVVAFAVLFVPVELGSMLLQKAKEALEIALAASGTYKLAQKVGGL